MERLGHLLSYHTRPISHLSTSSISNVLIQYEWAWKACDSSPPAGLMTPGKPNRSWWYDRRVKWDGGGGMCWLSGARHSPLPFHCFTTLQNSLLICCSVWAVWIVPASITIITAGAVGPPGPLGPLTEWPLKQITLPTPLIWGRVPSRRSGYLTVAFKHANQVTLSQHCP